MSTYDDIVVYILIYNIFFIDGEAFLNFHKRFVDFIWR